MKFVKMHGLGNDFMVFDTIHQDVELSPNQIIEWSDRHLGIGFDQCLVIEKSKDMGIDFFYRVFNANGQEVGQCGNGARCIARYIHRFGLSQKKNLVVATKTTRLKLKINDDETVTVEMAKPSFENNPLELALPDGSAALVYALDIGNPHAVSLVNDVAKAPV